MQLMAKFHVLFIYVFGLLCGMWFQPEYMRSIILTSNDYDLDIAVVTKKFNSSRVAKKHLGFGMQLAVSNDDHKHHDDDSVARKLFSEVKVLIWVMTAEKNHRSKAMTVKNTWGKHCNKLLFMSDAKDKDLPAIPIYNQTGREHLTGKTMKAFDYIYEHYFDDYDWFMKADDDTYVVVENLRYMLSEVDPNTPIYFGQHFQMILKQGYFSGGGGYVVSKEALRRFGKRDASLCTKDGGAEDVAFGSCMENLGVQTGDSRDSLNRTRFHCFDPNTHIHGFYPEWYREYDKYKGVSKGTESISDYAISFHYVSGAEMVNIHFFMYHLRPYGILSGLQDLNRYHDSVKS